MKPLALVLCLALGSCQSAPTKARAIMKPITKEVAKAKDIADRQRAGTIKLRGSVSRAAATAAAMNAKAPTPETAALTLDLNAATMEANVLIGMNDELRLTLANVEGEVAKAQDKVATEIASAEGWKKWAWRWFFGCVVLVVLIGAAIYFKAQLPFL